MEEVPRFALLEHVEGTIDHFVNEQENKNTRADTDRDVSLLKPFNFFKGWWCSGTLKKYLISMDC